MNTYFVFHFCTHPSELYRGWWWWWWQLASECDLRSTNTGHVNGSTPRRARDSDRKREFCSWTGLAWMAHEIIYKGIKLCIKIVK